MRVLKGLKDASNRILEIIRESEKAEKRKGEIYAGKGFGKLKGDPAWPVEGKVAIPYGSQRDPQFNTPIFQKRRIHRGKCPVHLQNLYQEAG